MTTETPPTQQPRFVSVSTVAAVFHVSTERIYQLIKEQKLVRNSEGKIDYRHALAFRAAQIQRDPTRTMLTAHTNDGRTSSLPKIKLILNEGSAPEVEEAVDTASDRASAQAEKAMARAERQAELKNLDLEERLATRQFQRAQAEGRYIDREAVRRKGVEAATLISQLLQGLPDKIAANFDEKRVKDQVRHEVQDQIDRMQTLLHTKLVEMIGKPDAK